MERRLAAILAADVVGYTALIDAGEAGRLKRLTELRQETLEPLITKHHGRIVKLIRDGSLVEFVSVVDTVACAIALQHRVAEHEADGEADTRLQFRIGINLGDVGSTDLDVICGVSESVRLTIVRCYHYHKFGVYIGEIGLSVFLRRRKENRDEIRARNG